MKWDRRLALLLVGGAALAFVFRALHLPAAWLFGPLVASAVSAVRGWKTVEFPGGVYLAGQATIGTALGAGFSPKTLGVLPHHLGIFSFAVVFILLTSLLNGWLLARYTKLNAATAFLGTMPGGAGVMAAMSDSMGANTQLVTAVQYTRLLIILASLACFGAVMKMHAHAGAVATIIAPPPAGFVAWKFGVLALLAFSGWAAGRWLRFIPAGTFLVPTLLYFGLSLRGIAPGTWPWPVLAAAYLIMGSQIGGRFHPSTVTMIRGVILPVIGTTVLLLGASVALAWIVMREMEISFASAYLAATPGGLDSVAAVATELRIDTTIVVTMHLVRILCVLIAGPWLVRACTRWFPPAKRAGPLTRREEGECPQRPLTDEQQRQRPI